MADLAAVLLGMPGTAPIAVERAAFRAPVRPGEDVRVHARRCGGGAVEAEVRVGGRLGALARLRFGARA